MAGVSVNRRACFPLRADSATRFVQRHMTPRLTLVACALTIARSLSAQTASEPPKVLPELKVSGNVPIVKVAEYHLVERRAGAAAVTAGGFIYVAGGTNKGNATLKSVERIDPRTGVSTTFAQLQFGRWLVGAAAVDGKLYVIGGHAEQLRAEGSPTGVPSADTLHMSPDGRIAAMDSDNNLVPSGVRLRPDNSVEIVDLATGRVSPGPPMPLARASCACIAFEKKIYVLGGLFVHGNRRGHTNSVDILDTTTGKWSEGPPMPSPRDATAVLVDGGFIMTAGGYNGTQASTEVAFLNPRDRTWRTLPELCRPTSAAAPVFLGRYLMLFGDYDRPEEILAYDLKTRTSETFTLSYLSARHASAVVLNEKIYVIGGKVVRDADAEDYVQVYELASKAPPKKG